MHVETVLEQLVLDPNHESFGSTLGSANFGPWLGLRLAKPHTLGLCTVDGSTLRNTFQRCELSADSQTTACGNPEPAHLEEKTHLWE